MEHYGSTLAATAAAVFGLVAATQILHPAYFEAPARPPWAVAAPAPAWIDPPAQRRAAAESPKAESPKPADRAAAEPAASPTSRIAAAAPPEVAAARPLPGEAVPERARRTAAAHRRRVASHGTRLRQAALDRGSAVPARVETAPTRDPGRIDPIGDLIRGLGLGRDG